MFIKELSFKSRKSTNLQTGVSVSVSCFVISAHILATYMWCVCVCVSNSPKTDKRIEETNEITCKTEQTETTCETRSTTAIIKSDI